MFKTLNVPFLRFALTIYLGINMVPGLVSLFCTRIAILSVFLSFYRYSVGLSR